MDVLLLIGGSRGLGRALVEVYHQKGWEVHEFSRTGQPPFNHPLDLSAPTEAERVFRAVLDTVAIPAVDQVVFLLNSAVILPIRKVARLCREEIVASLNVNVVSAVLLCQAFVERFRDFPGPKWIVNIGSGAAHRGFPGWSLYCAGKAAVEGFFRALYEEERSESRPFSVFTYDPHVMDTRMQEEIRASTEQDFPWVERFRALHRDAQLAKPLRVALHLSELIEARRTYDQRHEFGG